MLKPFDEVVRKDEPDEGGMVVRQMPSQIAEDCYKVMWFAGAYTDLAYEHDLKATGRNYRDEFKKGVKKKHG